VRRHGSFRIFQHSVSVSSGVVDIGQGIRRRLSPCRLHHAVPGKPPARALDSPINHLQTAFKPSLDPHRAPAIARRASAGPEPVGATPPFTAFYRLVGSPPGDRALRRERGSVMKAGPVPQRARPMA
jgi:hypothetical protein